MIRILSLLLLLVALWSPPPASATVTRWLPLDPTPSTSYPGYGPWFTLDGVPASFWTTGNSGPGGIDYWFRNPNYNISGSGTDVLYYLPMPAVSLNLQAAMSPNGPVPWGVYGRMANGGWLYYGVATPYWDTHSVSFTMNDPTPVIGITLYANSAGSWLALREVALWTDYTLPPPPAPYDPAPKYDEVRAPSAPGDVVARDLATFPAAAGHTGLWDGASVIQAMNESQVLQSTSWEDFKSRSQAWPTVTTNFPANRQVETCWFSTCNWADYPRYTSTGDYQSATGKMVLVRRARQLLLIGSDYTLSAYHTNSFPRMYDRATNTYTPAQRGAYRCDSFITEIFSYSYLPLGNPSAMPMTGALSPIPRYPLPVYDAFFDNEVRALLSVNPKLPTTIYEHLKGFGL